MTAYLGWSTHSFNSDDWRTMRAMLAGEEAPPVETTGYTSMTTGAYIRREHYTPGRAPFDRLVDAGIAERAGRGYALTPDGARFAREFAHER